MIPDSAIEAAERSALGRYLNKATIQLILEAAAPQLMAGAWDAAIAEADARHMIGGSDAEELKDANPYTT